jgi:uncharacterized Zn finger protein
MPTCQSCGTTHETTALVRHEFHDLLVVHCPDCNCMMGTYRDPGRNREA